MKQHLGGQWRAFAAELPGANPLPPFPLNFASRLVILVLFLAYFATGHLTADTGRALASVVAVVVMMSVAEISLLRARNDRHRLVRTWAWVLPLDILTVSIAVAADRHEVSMLSLVTLATVFTTSAMFATRYVFTIAALAGSAAFAANAAHAPIGEASLWMPAFLGLLIIGLGGFAANRGRAEEALRQDLIAARARERDHNRTLEGALEAARVHERRFMAISDNAPAALLLLDRERQLLFASRKAAAVFGEPDPVGWRPGNFGQGISLAHVRRMDAVFEAALAGHVGTAEFQHDATDGTRRQLSSIWFPLEEGAGAIITDVTKERTLAAQVVRAQQMETVGTLAGGIAHDFNNLLTAILGNLYMAREEVADGGLADACLKDAQLAVDRGAQLVRQLLDYARPGVEDTGPVDLAELVQETTKLASRGLVPGVEVTVELPPAGLEVEGNFGALQQVLMNLCLNARDAMPDGGEMRVGYVNVEAGAGAWCPGGQRPAAGAYHAISVTDTGSGITQADLQRIFDPFFTTKEVGKGTGLGLPTALGILRAHGGWLDVQTALGAGTTFWMLLPAGAAVGEPAESAA